MTTDYMNIKDRSQDNKQVKNVFTLTWSFSYNHSAKIISNHFAKIISNHLNIPTNHFISHKYFFMLNKSFHFAKDPESFSMLGHFTSRLDYCINSIQEHIDSSLLLRSLNFIRSFQCISQLLITM